MSYAIIRVRLPVVKNLKVKLVHGIADGVRYNLEIETVRYIRGKAKPTGKVKAIAKARTRKRKAVI